MDYVDLGTLSRKTITRRRGQRKIKLSSKLVGVLLIIIIGFATVKLLLSSATTVWADFWSASGSVISYMLPGSVKVKKDGGVTNVLLVGIDRRARVPYTYQGPDDTLMRNGFLADTIIVASLNYETDQLSMLSLPRDLWLEIPEFGSLQKQYSKINACYALGDRFSGEEDGGMLLLSQVLEDVLDIPIHYWARIDFVGFEKGVDAIGGIDLIVDQAFDDYQFPRVGNEGAPWDQRWEHVHFDAGLQHMDGATALKYARSRHALGPEGTDFARSKRQQKVIIAAKNKVVSSSTLFNPIKLKELFEVVSDNLNLKTDIKLSEIPLFFSLAKGLVDEEVQTYSLTDEGLSLLATPQDLSMYGGAWILLPTAGFSDYSDIQGFVKGAFYSAISEP